MDSDQGRFIRPYAITGGRTKSEGQEVALEAQVRTKVDPDLAKERYRWEASRIVDMCREATALIELAARLEIPIGATRIIVADLAKEGVLEISSGYEVTANTNSSEYESLLERVLDGIRSL